MSQQIAVQHPHAHEQNLLSFVLSLAAGIWMVATGGIMMSGFWMQGMMMGGAPYSKYGSHYAMYGWSGMYGWMYGRGLDTFGEWWPWFGFAAGFVVLTGAAFLYLNPQQRRSWGAMILAASALDFFLGMGGLVAGALGVIGGILAVAA
jgi:hypothetical protein